MPRPLANMGCQVGAAEQLLTRALFFPPKESLHSRKLSSFSAQVYRMHKKINVPETRFTPAGPHDPERHLGTWRGRQGYVLYWDPGSWIILHSWEELENISKIVCPYPRLIIAMHPDSRLAMRTLRCVL